jgi:hypothetical protein
MKKQIWAIMALSLHFATVEESMSAQVFVSSSSCPPFSAAPPSGASQGQAAIAQVGGGLRR